MTPSGEYAPTRLPTWVTGSGSPSEAAHETLDVPLPDGVATLAGALDIDVRWLVVAALARVAGVLASEAEVTIGYQPERGHARPVHAMTRGVTWRHLLDQVVEEADPLAIQRFTGDIGFGGDESGVALSVELRDDRLLVRYHRRVADAGYAGRIAGYLQRAIAALVAGPDALVDTTDLLSTQERQHQLHERGGEVRDLPAERFHEIFARLAAARPDDTAVVHRDQAFSYGWLNTAANQIAHGLLAEGLRASEVVMTATERHPLWLAAIIGIFKAGGVYLPAEPDFPAARVTTLREQSGCRIVLTESASLRADRSAESASLRADQSAESDVAGMAGYAGLAAALTEPGVLALPIADLLAAGHPATDPDVAVAVDQDAYIYFTSGSTGQPKGAVCTHHGMINHLVAKVVDFEIDQTSVVVQNAVQTFDISLWQLLAPLMVGGHTLILARDEILDLRRFVAAITRGGATILQVVPSYLDILLRLAELGGPLDLGRLRYVCATGEALSKALVVRWFARFPDIRLVNAYGATEASDDTNHEIMSGVPAEDLVPVGRPVVNVTVYVLGPGDTLVPLGASGEIVFSGVCVGRGYANDPARTAEAFGDDPFRPGARIYRSGDTGRWLPTGSLEFHGRRDEQVKVNGIRIELGEVEARILEHPRVLAAAVVVTPLPGAGKSLVAFYETGDGPADSRLRPDDLRAHLQATLPASSVPARLFGLERLPLSPNGKIDKRALADRARTLANGAAAGVVPRTPTEQRIAAAWAAALNRPVEEIGGDDHFFEIGGGSLTALRVVAGLEGFISLLDLLNHPVLSDLAAVVDRARMSPC